MQQKKKKKKERKKGEFSNFECLIVLCRKYLMLLLPWGKKIHYCLFLAMGGLKFAQPQVGWEADGVLFQVPTGWRG